MPIRRSLLAGFLTLAVGLVIFFPARVAYHALFPSEVRLAGIDGSIWNGSATDASVAGFYLRGLDWRFRPSAIFGGRVAWSFEASPMSGFIEGTVEVRASGAVALRQLTAAVPLELLREIVGNAALAGNLGLRIETLEAVDGIPTRADGTFEVANLVDPRLYERSLGGYRGQAETLADGVLVTYEDTDGLVDIDGRIVIGPDGVYRHTARLRPKAGTPERIRQFIAVLPPAADGSDWREYVLGEGRL